MIYFFSKKEPLKNPVLTMDGITYEKQTLMEHFLKVGYFDRLTKKFFVFIILLYIYKINYILYREKQ